MQFKQIKTCNLYPALMGDYSFTWKIIINVFGIPNLYKKKKKKNAIQNSTITQEKTPNKIFLIIFFVYMYIHFTLQYSIHKNTACN